jgi:phosphonate transport system substrate-binding protein
MQKRSFIRALSLAALAATPLAALSQTTPAAPAGSAAKPNLKPRPKAKPLAAPSKVVFGLITPRNAEQTLKSWTPFLERMSKSLGVTAEAKTYAQQGDLVTDFKAGKVDFAWMGNVPAIEVVEARVGAVFGQLVVKGQYAYRSLLVTHQSSAIRTLDDILKSKGTYVFGDGDLKSTSGHIVPRYFAFAKKGVNDVDAMFKEIKRGSHIDNLNRVAKKEVDFATNNTTELDLFKTNNPELAKDIRVVWESPDIPESPLVWCLALPVDFRKKVQDFIVAFGKDDEEKAILKDMNNLTAFRKSGNSQLLNVADIEGFNARQRLINDTTLSAAERATKIEEVIKRGSKLEFLLKQRAVL